MDSESSLEDDHRLRSVPPVASFATEGDLLDGRYRLDELIGRGGTAEVYRATDELLGRAVAVKVFDVRLTDLNSIERQRSEMRLLAALDDSHLVAVYDARMVDAPGGPAGAQEHSYLVMELVSGATLAERLRDGPLSPADAAPVGVAVAAGLAAAHARGLVHRDVKPANVLLATSGAVKLGDFGLARMVAAETRFTSGSALIGTAAYFSPEQARSESVGPAADVYALGLVLLEALTGRREFPGAAVPSAMARLLRDPQIPDGLPAPWPTLLLRMTDRDPDARPAAADIARILSHHPAAIADTIGTRPGAPESVPVVISPSGSDASDESVTTASSSILSAFLHPEAAAASRARRRNGLLFGAAALIVAVALTVGISVSGEPPSEADTTPPAVQRSDTGQATPSPSQSLATTPTRRSTTSSAMATISSQRPSTAAAARTGPPTSSVATSSVPRPTSPEAAEPIPAVVPAAARISSAQQPSTRPATPASPTSTLPTANPPTATPPTSPPGARQASAAQAAASLAAAQRRTKADKASKKAAESATEKAAASERKAAEKEQQAAQKAASKKSKGGRPAKPGKKP